VEAITASATGSGEIAARRAARIACSLLFDQRPFLRLGRPYLRDWAIKMINIADVGA
jgi:hypothetical protein